MIDATALAIALRDQCTVTDARFDRLFPAGHRFRSYCHWTPIEVALRACALLGPRAGERVLDVGAGVGKLCLVGAVTTEATWVGVELDAKMVQAASRAARQLAVSERVAFVHGDAGDLDWSTFEAIYMFNPFAEGLLRSNIDPIAPERFHEHVERARRLLATTRPGTRLVTYHGIGGELPDMFRLEHREPARADHLCLWTHIQ